MELLNKDKDNLDKILKHNKEWLHKNETQKTNSILAILTFFIAFGEISLVSKNISEQLNINYFWIFTPLIIITILSISLILNCYNTKRKNHIREILKHTGNITSGKEGIFLGT